MPDTIAGLPRTSIEAERNAAIGIQVSNASAVYQNPQGNPRIELEITDTGGAKGFLAMAGFAGVEEDKQTDSGYEKTYRDGNRLIHEEWNKSGNGEYTVIIADRFVVAVKGNGVADIGALKAALASVNLAGLEALTHARRQARIKKRERLRTARASWWIVVTAPRANRT